MKATIKEIAKIAGVHRATVDKVLHNRVGVSDEVRQKVQQIIDQVEYRPNPAGQILQKQGREYRIAAVLVNVDALPFLKAGIQAGVEQQTGFNIRMEYHITNFQEAQKQAAVLQKLISEKVDGIIISPIHSEQVREAVNKAAEAGIPVVTIDSDIDAQRLCYVGLDSVKASRVAGRLMGQFLNGHGKVAVVSSAVPEENNTHCVAIREHEFAEFVERNYPRIELVDRVESLENAQITYQKTREILQDHPDLRGLYVTCGGVPEVGRALRESGREQDIVVISYEDYPKILELMREGVIDCTLAGDLRRQGALPVQIIMNYLVFGKKPEHDKMFTEIKILVKECLP